MVFQQRNGRIDRYGQKKSPDIRYMLIESDNKKIKGDMRIIEILINKEEQASKNIGDPALLLGKFSVEDEELVVAEAIEDGSNADAFEQILNPVEEEFDPFEALFADISDYDDENIEESKAVKDETLFTDKNYLKYALLYLNQSEKYSVKDLETVSGLKIKLTDDMKNRLKALIPEEAMPKIDTLCVSDNKSFCMQQMQNNTQNGMNEAEWPTQYLWKLHPILTWANDKISLLFKRNEAPVICRPNCLDEDEIIYIVNGSIPNLKSTPMVDEWFGILYKDKKFIKILTMNEVVQRAQLSNIDLSNRNSIKEKDISLASSLTKNVVEHSKEYLEEHYNRYINEINPLLGKEVDKLAELEERHKKHCYQTTDENKLDAKLREIDNIFVNFTDWVTQTLTIKNNPYIRIISVIMGVS